MQAIRIIGITAIIGFIAGAAFGQARSGLKGGTFFYLLDADPVVLLNDSELPQYELSVANTSMGLQAGFFILARVSFIYIEPELSYQAHSVKFLVRNLESAEIDEEIRTERYRNLDFPLNMGFRFGPIRVGGGPVGHIFLSSSSELNDLDGYEADHTILTWGWQAGLGVDIWQLHLEARYEGNFSDFGSHMTYNGQAYSFNTNPSRVLITAGISF